MMKVQCLNWVVLGVAAGLSVFVTAAKADAVKQFPLDVDTYIDSRSPTFNWGVGTTAKVVVNGADGSLTRSSVQTA